MYSVGKVSSLCCQPCSPATCLCLALAADICPHSAQSTAQVATTCCWPLQEVKVHQKGGEADDALLRALLDFHSSQLAANRRGLAVLLSGGCKAQVWAMCRVKQCCRLPVWDSCCRKAHPVTHGNIDGQPCPAPHRQCPCGCSSLASLDEPASACRACLCARKAKFYSVPDCFSDRHT